MERSTAEGLAGGGGLLAAISLALPWYSLHAGEAMTAQAGFDASLGGRSGWEALGPLRWVVLALALAAGWRLTRTLRAELPIIAAAGLLLVVGIRWTSPPGVADALAGELPSSGSPVNDAIGQAFVGAFTESLGLELRPSYGIAVAALGAGMALAGSLASDR